MKEMNLPKIGLGTMLANTKKAMEGLKKGIEIGFRFIDTAQIYFNEKVVGEAIRESGIPRDEIFLATKLWISNYSPRKVFKSVDKSLRKLNVDYVDLLYIHWPWKFNKLNQTIEAINKLIDQDKVHHYGVSNFTPSLVDKILEFSEKPIFANQVEMHPWLQQQELLKHHKKNNIHVVAYFPLMHGRFKEVPELLEIAKKYNTNGAKISLAWIIAKGAIPIPKSVNEKHLKDNFGSLKLKLQNKDITLIDSIKKTKRFANVPFLSPKW